LREEEGHAVFSRLPIVGSDHLLLPRDASDADDGHQRAVLHAALHVPWWPRRRDVLDVYSTHWSLSDAARRRSAAAVDAFARRGRGAVSVVAGDLNAEPHEASLEALRGAGFSDAWTRGHPEPLPGSGDPWAVAHAHTFPSCNAIKRIDFILARANGLDDGRERFSRRSSSSNSSSSGGLSDGGLRSGGLSQATATDVEVVSCAVVGQAPAGRYFTPRAGLGMLDDDSPVWGSDHRAVVAELRLTQTPQQEGAV
jgi:hypothetical protein